MDIQEVYIFTNGSVSIYGLQQPGCILCQKLVIIFFTLSKFCDFFWNAHIKTDLSLFRQLCGPSNNFQPVLDITCFLRPPGGRGPRLTLKVNSSFRADRGLPMIQTAQNHTLIQNNMLHPSKYYQMHPQLTARTPRGPLGPPRGP